MDFQFPVVAHHLKSLSYLNKSSRRFAVDSRFDICTQSYHRCQYKFGSNQTYSRSIRQCLSRTKNVQKKIVRYMNGLINEWES